MEATGFKKTLEQEMLASEVIINKINQELEKLGEVEIDSDDESDEVVFSNPAPSGAFFMSINDLL